MDNYIFKRKVENNSNISIWRKQQIAIQHQKYSFFVIIIFGAILSNNVTNNVFEVSLRKSWDIENYKVLFWDILFQMFQVSTKTMNKSSSLYD